MEVDLRLPGFHAHEIEVGIEPWRLFISARKAQKENQQPEGESDAERGFDGIFRALDLPEQVNPATVTATFKHGDLRLTLPRAFAQAHNSDQ
jgi:HSP20 family molecular chaperone IbpA